MEAANGFEALNGGFADLSLNHLGTRPCANDSSATYGSFPLIAVIQLRQSTNGARWAIDEDCGRTIVRWLADSRGTVRLTGGNN